MVERIMNFLTDCPQCHTYAGYSQPWTIFMVKRAAL